MSVRIKKAAVFAVISMMMVGTAQTDAQAKPKSLRVRMHALEKRMRALEVAVADAQDAADAANTGVAILFGCIGVVAVDPFTLPGADPTLDQYPLGLSKSPPNVAPAYWVAIVDNACLAAPTAAPARSFGARSWRVAR